MKRFIACLLASGLAGVLAAGLLAEEPAGAPPQGALPWPGAELNLRIFEGLRYAGTPPTKVVTSSFLRFLNYTSLQVESDESVERQVRQVFNLKDAKLVSEANLQLGKEPAEKAFHIFRLDSREYLILVTRGRRYEERQFHIEVYEQGAKEKASLLDMEFGIPAKNAAVFGFEDTEGNPYFLAFSVLHYGTKGGIAAGAGGETAPPRLVKSVNPVYPEIARQSKVQGVVVLEATTDVYGRVAMVKVLRSIPLLDQAAVDAVRQWEYEPAIIDGQPKQVTFTVAVQFDLKNEKAAAGVTGGVVGGVLGGVVSGVAGGVEGGVQGGVAKTVGALDIQAEKEFEGDAVRAVGDVKPPTLLKVVDPVYPEIARQAQVEGVVILEARTDEKGNVEDARVLRSIPLLDQAAIDALKQWKYEPLVIDGKPRKVLFTVTVRFALKTGDKEKDLEKFAQGAVKAVGDVKPPRLVHSVEPVYPEDAKKAGVEGLVVLSVKADASGQVQDVMVLRSVPQLNQAAIDAVRQWVYEPYIKDGKATPIVFTVTVRFQLGNKEKAGSSDVLIGGPGLYPKAFVEGVPTPPSKEQAEFEKGAVKAMDTIKPPKLIKAVAPVYPEIARQLGIARQAGVEGVVILEAKADEQGNVVDVRILRSIPLLDQSAVDALRQWKYEPLIIDGKPRKVIFTVTVRFALDNGSRKALLKKFAWNAALAEGDVKPPKLVRSVEPVYPEAARQAQVEGVVILGVKTGENGKVIDAIILRSIPLLDQAAIDAVKQWVYEPLVLDGKPMPVVFSVTVRFENPDKGREKKKPSWP